MTWNPETARGCWFLTGPTAVGKSELALRLAERLSKHGKTVRALEVVALDSMTLYRGMEIGTAKPSLADQQRVRHHLLDQFDPSESSTVARYLELAEQKVQCIQDRSATPLFVGGAPLYLKALLRGLFDGPPADRELRNRLEADAEYKGSDVLHAELAAVDPLAASRIAVADIRRIVRALEVFQLSGRPISHWQQQFDRPLSPPPKVACVVRPRAELRQRIAERVDAMLQAGWVQEVEQLFARSPAPGREARQAVGYAEIHSHLTGGLTWDAMRDRIIARTSQFAKRQMTWFRHLEECVLFEISENDTSVAVEERLQEFFVDPSPSVGGLGMG